MGKTYLEPRTAQQIDEAIDLYESFSGHAADEAATIELPDDFDALVCIGQCDGVLYTTVRDGKTEKYIHQFSRSSRPLLTCTPDGKNLVIIGGSYQFTELGIVDDSDT